MKTVHKKIRLAAVTLLLSMAGVTSSFADDAGSIPARRTRPSLGGVGGEAPFPFQGGEAIYKGVCQGCHMPDAKGAVGAGLYPALARNENLETAGYPVGVIVVGQKAMPALGGMLNDQQVADVVNYIRTHFGNRYTDKVTAADVKTMR